MSFYLLSGNPLEPCDGDMLAQTEQCRTGEKPNGYDGRNCGWRVVSGNHIFNTWARVVMRYEVAAQCDTQCPSCGQSDMETDESGLIDTCRKCETNYA